MLPPATERPWLVADIGGTNARFALVDAPGAAPRDIQVVPTAEHAGPVEAAMHYLASVGVHPLRAAFAVATAVQGDQVAFTNSPWNFSRKQACGQLGLDELLVINDFEALALALPRLQPSQLRAHGILPDRTGATLAVVGPGTGLGVAGVMKAGRQWLAIAGEGGHATMAACDEFEATVIAHARQHFEHVSAERLLAGTGLPHLHQGVARALGVPAPELTAAQIVESGVKGTDAVCVRTLDTFCAMLGSFAGNVALTLGARGGVFVGGGIVPRMADLFFASRFRERFVAKGRFRAYLEGVPTALIVEPFAALVGGAAALQAAGPSAG
jgi:glucokinase